MNNFREMCPSGNTLIDCELQEKALYIEDIEGLRQYINEHLPTLKFGSIRDLVKEFRKQGYIKIETKC